MIMEMVENLLGVKEVDDEETEMETDEQLPPIEAGESVVSCDKGKKLDFCWNYLSERMCAKIQTKSLF